MRRFSRWLIIAPAVFFALLPQQVDAADVLVNPSFAFDGGGWTGALTTGTDNSACDGGLPNIGTWTASRLSFSYALTSVTQTVAISVPSAVSFSWSSVNRSDQPNATATVTLTDADESLTTGTFITPITDTAGSLGTVTTTADDEMVTVTISGQDSQSWAGCYGTQFTVSALDVTLIAPPPTTVPETTTTTTTTTVPETTTTATTTTVPETTTTATTTTVAETTTTTTTTTQPPPPATTQAETTTTTEVPPTTTTTTEVPPTTTSQPPDTIVPTTEQLTTTTKPLPLPVNISVPPAPIETTPPTTTTTYPATIPAIVAEPDAIESLSVTAIMEQGVSPEQATELAMSAEVLDSISGDQAEEVFSAVPVDALTAEQGQAIVDAVQDAPAEVRKAFEKVINLFGGQFDEYVPLGSNIPISSRRTLVVIGATMMAASGSIPSSRRKT